MFCQLIDLKIFYHPVNARLKEEKRKGQVSTRKKLKNTHIERSFESHGPQH